MYIVHLFGSLSGIFDLFLRGCFTLKHSDTCIVLHFITIKQNLNCMHLVLKLLTCILFVSLKMSNSQQCLKTHKHLIGFFMFEDINNLTVYILHVARYY